jgi:hypothetical protein
MFINQINLNFEGLSTSFLPDITENWKACTANTGQKRFKADLL